MISSPDITRETERFHRSFTYTKKIIGVDMGEPAERFKLLIEAAWDLGVIGVDSTECDETINDYFDSATLEGQMVRRLFNTMYERSLEVHGKDGSN